MNNLGDTARQLREARGLSQKEAADVLGVTAVHLCNIEKNKSAPSRDLVNRMREFFGVDLYMLTWCLYGDVEALPERVRNAARQLSNAWCQQLQLGHMKQGDLNATSPTTKTSSSEAGYDRR